MADAAIDDHANDPSKLMHTKHRKVDVTVVQPIRTIITRLWVPALREQQLGTTVARLALVGRTGTLDRGEPDVRTGLSAAARHRPRRLDLAGNRAFG